MITRRKLINLDRLVVRYATGWDKMPKGWSQKSFKKFWNTLTEESDHPWTKCVEKMTGKIDDPEKFCSSAKDQALGTTKWRGKDKKASPEEKSGMTTKHDDQLRAETIRLAHAKPELRKHLLPLVKEADAERKAWEEQAKIDEGKEAGGDDKEAFTPSRRKGPTKKMDPTEKRKQQQRRRKQPKSEKKKQQRREEKLEQRRPGQSPSQRKASAKSFRGAVIRLAHEKPHLREHLLPILEETRQTKTQG